MTVNQILKAALIEQDKVEAPSLTIQQYNYFINKSIDNVLKINYSYYNPNQIQSDKLYTLKKRVNIDLDLDNLEGTASMYTGDPTTSYSDTTFPLFITDRGIKFLLPDDYWHFLAGKVKFTPKNRLSGNCSTGEDLSILERPLKRATSDLLSASLENSYNRPQVYGRSGPGMIYYDLSDNPQPAIHIPNSNVVPGINNGEIEIITGLRHVGLIPTTVSIEYLKVYKPVVLTYDQYRLDVVPGSSFDTSDTMEFTNSVCQDIITELIKQLAGNTKETDRVQIKDALGPKDGGIPMK